MQPIPAYSSQAEALREATFLLGEGDRLNQAGHIDEAREKWLAAATAYEQAKDGLGEADAYIRLADSYTYSLDLLNPKNQQLAADYYQAALSAAAEVYETLVQNELTYDQETLTEANSLYRQGVEQYEAGNCNQALPFLENARQLYQSIEFGSGEVRSLVVTARCQLESGDYLNAMINIISGLQIANNLPLGTPTTELYLQGQDQYEQGDLAQAKQSFEEALEQYKQADDAAGVAQVMLDLANIYAILGDYVQAEAMYRQAQAMFFDQEDIYNQAAAHHNLANLAILTGRYAEAIEGFQTAGSLWRSLGKPVEEVASLNGLGLALREQGDYQAALTIFNEALTLQQRLSPNPESEGDLLNNIGMVHLAQGYYQKALNFFEQALILRRQLPHRQKEAETLSNIASVQARLGRFREALVIYDQVLELEDELKLPVLQAKTRLNIASVYSQQGNYQAAIAAYLQILPTAIANTDRPTEASIHLNIGATYLQLGDLPQALNHFDRSLQIFEEIGNREGIARVRANLGLHAIQAGDLDDAETHLDEALAAWREVGNSAAASQVLGNLAILSINRGDFRIALSHAQQALELSKQAGNQADASRFLIVLGVNYLALGDYTSALEHATQAMEVAEQVGDPAAEMGAQLVLAATYYLQQETVQAYEHVKIAIDRLEMLQGAITVSELKSTFLGNLIDAYSLAVLTAIELNRPEEAFRYAEQARARAFLDQIANGPVEFRAGVEPSLLEQEQLLREQIKALRTQLITLRSYPRTEWDTETISAVRSELSRLEDEYSQLLENLKIQSPQTASLVAADVASLGEVQHLLDNRVTLIEYFVTDDRTLAFVITHDEFQTVTLNVTREQLVRTISSFRDFASLEDPHPLELQQLYQWLIEPLKPSLKTPLLGIVPHSVLHYLPFAALTDGQRYLIEDYALFNLPGASLLRFSQEGKGIAQIPILALGNPTTPESLPNLRFAEQEAEAIANLYGAEALIGKTATESVVRSNGKEAGILHLAAHGTLNTHNPLFSTIHLAPDGNNDGRLEVLEIYGLDLRNATELVVLSACDTIIGELSAGDEVVGLNRAFLYTGSPAVIASLWNIDDESTSLLMQRFYTHLHEGMSRAEALRQAQHEVRSTYANPYYWSGFVLTGDPN